MIFMTDKKSSEEILASLFTNYADISIKELPRFQTQTIDEKKIKTLIGHYRYPKILIIVQGKSIPEYIQKNAGGHISRLHMKWRWELVGSEVESFCKKILPFLSGEKKDLALFIIDYIQNAEVKGQTTRYKFWLDRIKSGKEKYKAFNPVNLGG